MFVSKIIWFQSFFLKWLDKAILFIVLYFTNLLNDIHLPHCMCDQMENLSN